MQLVPLIDNFEAAKNAIKVQSDAEQKIVDSYQVRCQTPVLGCMQLACIAASAPYCYICVHTKSLMG